MLQWKTIFRYIICCIFVHLLERLHTLHQLVVHLSLWLKEEVQIYQLYYDVFHFFSVCANDHSYLLVFLSYFGMCCGRVEFFWRRLSKTQFLDQELKQGRHKMGWIDNTKVVDWIISRSVTEKDKKQKWMEQICSWFRQSSEWGRFKTRQYNTRQDKTRQDKLSLTDWNTFLAVDTRRKINRKFDHILNLQASSRDNINGTSSPHPR